MTLERLVCSLRLHERENSPSTIVLGYERGCQTEVARGAIEWRVARDEFESQIIGTGEIGRIVGRKVVAAREREFRPRNKAVRAGVDVDWKIAQPL